MQQTIRSPVSQKGQSPKASETRNKTVYAELRLYLGRCDDHCLGKMQFDAKPKDNRAKWYHDMALRIVEEQMDWQRRHPTLDWIKPDGGDWPVKDYAAALALITFCKKNMPNSESVIELVESADDTIRFVHKIRFDNVSPSDRQGIIEKLNQSGLFNYGGELNLNLSPTLPELIRR